MWEKLGSYIAYIDVWRLRLDLTSLGPPHDQGVDKGVRSRKAHDWMPLGFNSIRDKAVRTICASALRPQPSPPEHDQTDSFELPIRGACSGGTSSSWTALKICCDVVEFMWQLAPYVCSFRWTSKCPSAYLVRWKTTALERTRFG